MVCSLVRDISKNSTPQISYTLATQRERDPESGLMHYRARSYDPRLGRFVQKDPQDRVMEHYRYARNNPVRATDPTGLTSLNIINNAIRESYFAIDWLKKVTGLPEEYAFSLHRKGIDLLRHQELVLKAISLKWKSNEQIGFLIEVLQKYTSDEIKYASVTFQAYEYLTNQSHI